MLNLDKVLEKAPENRHSYFQLQHFVIGKEPTRQAQMWQCLREMQSRKESIDNINLEIEEAKDALEIIDIEIKEADFPSKYKEVKLRQLERKNRILSKTINNLQNKLKFVEQEVRFLLNLFETINKEEKLKDYDDLEAQKELWNAKITEEVHLRILMQQPIDVELTKTVLALPDDMPVKQQMTNLIERKKDIIAQIKFKGEHEENI